MPSSFASATSALELLERAELRVDRVVAALAPSRSPTGCRGRSALRRQRVVPALAVRAADRVDRRQVDDVEAELGELRQQRAHALEAAPRAREELVPGAEARERAGRRRPRRSATTSSRSGRRPAPRAPPRPSASRAPSSTAPSASSLGEILLARRRPCAAAPPGTTRRGRPRPRSRKHQVPARSTSNEPAQWSLPSGSSGASCQRVAPAGL